MAAPMENGEDLVECDDFYAWLGLGRNASGEEIKNAFRKFSRIYHPDKHEDAETKAKAEVLFTKIKKAYEVLSDPHTKAIYDTMGDKGLDTDGWEVVPRTKTPQEIIEEYERIAQDREQKRLEQRTNPTGTILVGIDATDLFDSYQTVDDFEYRSGLPHIEINQMSISQSVECPLTSKNTAVLMGNLTTKNGTGHGSIGATFRRVISYLGWAEVEVSAGGGALVSVKGFRTLWRRGFGTMAGSLQLTPQGIRPGLTAMVATQLDKNVQGRLTWNGGGHPGMSTMLVWDNERHHLSCGLQLGIHSSHITANYVRKLAHHDVKLKGGIRLGTFGAILEYGCDKKITQFSTLGATMVIGTPLGVTLKIRLHRGNQNFIFTVHMSDEVLPSAIFYGTMVPLAAFFIVKILLVNPFLKEQKEQEIQKKKEANLKRMQEKQKEVEITIELMKETVDRCYEMEERKGGLIIKKSLYGKLQGEDNLTDHDCIKVARPLQALVKDSRLVLADGTRLSELPGFYDPCVGEEKELLIVYEFRRQSHMAKFKEKERILIPNRDHLFNGSSNDLSDQI